MFYNNNTIEKQTTMFFKNWNKKIIFGIVCVIFGIVLVTRMVPSDEQFTISMNPGSSADGEWGPYQRNVQEYGGPFPSGITKDALTEGFVPWNSEEVGKYEVSLVRLDQLSLVSLFKSLVEEDKGKIDVTYLTPFRKQPHGMDQAKAYVNHVLARINRKSDRKFHILDIQATNKEAAFDTRSKDIVDKWTSELFIQEKDSRKVHAHAMNIRMEMLTKGKDVKIVELHFVTDYFYKRPLVGGDNPHKKYFRIKNPFHLEQPFFTSEDKVLPNTADADEILVNHHNDLRKPKYRCFQEAGGSQPAGNETECDISSGYWDKPVTNDSECPFFKSNRLFPNSFGGKSIEGDGTCEMPLGTKRIGYRFISNDPQHKPMCYNCHVGADGNSGSQGFCCQEQRNVELYPELGGNPDFAFSGDVLERGQFSRLLSSRGLHWRAHPTNIRDITNPHQKQPVFNAFIGAGPGKL